MSETKPQGPNEKPTVEIPKVDRVLDMIQQAVDLGKSNAIAIGQVGADVTGLVTNARITNERLGRLELWKDNTEQRLTNGSERVRQVSSNDEAQAKALADEKLAREALATKVDKISETAETALTKSAAIDAKQDVQIAFLKDITDSVAKNPMVRRIAYAAGLLALAVIGYVAALIQAAANKGTHP